MIKRFCCGALLVLLASTGLSPHAFAESKFQTTQITGALQINADGSLNKPAIDP